MTACRRFSARFGGHPDLRTWPGVESESHQGNGVIIMRAKFVLAALAALLFQAGVAASTALAASGGGRQDTISIELRTEGWVENQTAKVMTLLDIALKPEEAGTARDEARMPESELGGLHETARGLSRPGRQVRNLGIGFSPTLAEQKAALTALREDIYRQAQAELDLVRALWPDRDYRIHVIDLVPGGMTPPQPGPKMMRAEATMAYDSSGGGGDGFSASRRLTVYAVVSLAVRNSDK